MISLAFHLLSSRMLTKHLFEDAWFNFNSRKSNASVSLLFIFHFYITSFSLGLSLNGEIQWCGWQTRWKPEINNYFDLKIWLGLVLFKIDVGRFFGACSVTILFYFIFYYYFFNFLIFFLILVQNLFGIKILRMFLILFEGVLIFYFFIF